VDSEGYASYPFHPERFWSHLARAYFVARRYEEAIKALQRLNQADHMKFVALAACYAALDNEGAAKDHVQEILKRVPDFNVGDYLSTQHYKLSTDLEHCRGALLKAGLPQKL
jgi:adenylate cyclase